MLEKRFVARVENSDSTLTNKGTSVPPWFPNLEISSWYSDSSTSFFYNVVSEKDVYVQYGKNVTGWASARFFGQTVEVLNEVENDDGSITATVKVQANFFRGRKNELSSGGYRVNYKITINGQTMYDFSGSTTSNFDQNSRTPIEFSVTLQPEELNESTTFKVDVEYPDGQFTRGSITIGLALYNPNPPTYVPMSIRKGNNWRDLDTNNGKIRIRKGSSWVDKSEENNNTSKQVNQGKNRIRKNSQWRQLPKMNGGNVT